MDYIAYLVIVVAVTIIFKQYLDNKKLNTNIIALNKKLKELQKTFDYKKDFEYMESIINEKCSYYYLLEIKPKLSVTKGSSNMINDESFMLVVVKACMTVKECLSEEYLKKLEVYNEDIEGYLLEKVYVTLLMLTLNVNKEIVSKIMG